MSVLLILFLWLCVESVLFVQYCCAFPQVSLTGTVCYSSPTPKYSKLRRPFELSTPKSNFAAAGHVLHSVVLICGLQNGMTERYARTSSQKSCAN